MPSSRQSPSARLNRKKKAIRHRLIARRRHTLGGQITKGRGAITLHLGARRIRQRNKDFTDAHLQQLTFELIYSESTLLPRHLEITYRSRPKQQHRPSSRSVRSSVLREQVL